MGNCIYKNSSETGQRKYIVDIAGNLPTILLEIDDSNDIIKKTYIYANSEILAQHEGPPATNNKYFYLHDRLGSVRLVVNGDGDVNNSYTYTPFGEMFASECNEMVYNPFKFTGRRYDSKTGLYYCRDRYY